MSSELGGRPTIVHWFQQWGSGETRFRPAWASAVAQQGGVPLITWEPWAKPRTGISSPTQSAYSLARIAAGDHDRLIRAWARAAAQYGKPVLLRPMHEMNGNWYPWGVYANGNRVGDYVPAWRHIVDIFRAERADNVHFVWSVNNDAGAGRVGALDPLYPGGDYVDWVATSAFNWGNAYSWSSWRSAGEVVGPTYRLLCRYKKPIMISELGTTTNGGNRGAWIRDAITSVRERMPKVRAVVWYSAVDQAGLDFRVRDLPGVLAPPTGDWYAAPRLAALRSTDDAGRRRP